VTLIKQWCTKGLWTLAALAKMLVLPIKRSSD